MKALDSRDIDERKTATELLYLRALELSCKESEISGKARKQCSDFASSPTGLLAFFIAGVCKDKLFHKPGNFAKVKTNRWLKLYVAKWIQSLFL